MSARSCQLRRKADQRLYLNDEGELERAEIEAQIEVERAHIAVMKEDNNRRGMTCDACRETNAQCQRQHNAHSMGSGSLEENDMLADPHNENLVLRDQAPCITCTASNAWCEFILADLNRGLSRLLAGSILERAYQERMMLRDQQGNQPTALWPR